MILPLLLLLGAAQAPDPEPVRVAVVGLTHTHVHWVLGREDRGDIEIVGIYETNRDLAERYSAQHGYSMDLVWDDLDAMLDAVRPEAVLAFNPIYDHLATVQAAAPRGIHVMVEKPLAVSLEHAEQMAALAREHGIELLTNYETTWYGSTHAARRIAPELGPMRKLVVRDGHQGPKEIGVNEEFLEWLTDPVLNGGGALTDFGCYGANLITWLMRGERPLSVTAVTQQIKPDVYPDVDDEATIIVTYPETQGIIQASWNWPMNRKDLSLYGRDGYLHALDGTRMRLRLPGDSVEAPVEAEPLAKGVDDPFAWLAGVIRGTIDPEEYDLSSLENNLIVMEILEAAKVSAAEGRTVRLAR